MPIAKTAIAELSHSVLLWSARRKLHCVESYWVKYFFAS